MEDLVVEADVIVVGGGSAGCTAAIRAQEDLPRGRVVLLEKAHIKRSGAIAIGMDGPKHSHWCSVDGTGNFMSEQIYG